MRRIVLCGLLLSCEAPPDRASASDPTALSDLELCDPIREWNPELIALEVQMLDALDERRSQGQHCGTRGSFAPAPPLRRSPGLHCAARLHALDMAEAGFVDHVGSDDSTAWDRIRDVEYAFATADEVVVASDLPPQDILDTLWLPREGSCAALSATAYLEVGVGVALPFDEDDPVPGRRWTLVLAKPIE